MQPARHFVAGLHLNQRRIFPVAALEDMGAARGEGAGGGKFRQQRRLAGNRLELFGALAGEVRQGLQQRRRVGVLRVGVERPDLHAAARSLAGKIDAALPGETIAEADAWKFAVHPFADAARGLSHMATLRSAIQGRQKLELGYRQGDGAVQCSTVRPLRVDYFGRIWTLIAWCELSGDFRMFRVDLVETARPLPELFVDEPGKRLSDLPGAAR